MGGAWSVSFWAYWNEFSAYSRIIDFGNGADKDNIIICQDPNPRNFWVSLRIGNQHNLYNCPNQIDHMVYAHYAVIMRSNGEIDVYKNGAEVACNYIANVWSGTMPTMVR